MPDSDSATRISFDDPCISYSPCCPVRCTANAITEKKTSQGWRPIPCSEAADRLRRRSPLLREEQNGKRPDDVDDDERWNVRSERSDPIVPEGINSSANGLRSRGSALNWNHSVLINKTRFFLWSGRCLAPISREKIDPPEASGRRSAAQRTGDGFLISNLVSAASFSVRRFGTACPPLEDVLASDLSSWLQPLQNSKRGTAPSSLFVLVISCDVTALRSSGMHLSLRFQPYYYRSRNVPDVFEKRESFLGESRDVSRPRRRRVSSREPFHDVPAVANLQIGGSWRLAAGDYELPVSSRQRRPVSNG